VLGIGGRSPGDGGPPASEQFSTVPPDRWLLSGSPAGDRSPAMTVRRIHPEREPEPEPEPGVPEYEMLSDLLKNPDLLMPPKAVVPHLGWAGRITLIASPEKFGKSTLLRQAVAALSTGGHFLDGRVAPEPVAWLRLDEPKADLVRLLSHFGAHDGVAISEQRGLGAYDLHLWLNAVSAKLLVVDTLLEWVSAMVENLYDARQWLTPLAGLRQVAQTTGAAIILLHHTVRDGTRYADSRQIGAGVDQIITMTGKSNDPTFRLLNSRGRCVQEQLAIRYDPITGNALDQGETPVPMRTYRAIAQTPGVGKTKLRAQVGGKAEAVDQAIEHLLATRAIEDRPDDGGHHFFVRHPASAAGPGQTGTGVGQGSGQGWAENA
jgi:hypothetical protein